MKPILFLSPLYLLRQVKEMIGLCRSQYLGSMFTAERTPTGVLGLNRRPSILEGLSFVDRSGQGMGSNQAPPWAMSVWKDLCPGFWPRWPTGLPQRPPLTHRPLGSPLRFRTVLPSGHRWNADTATLARCEASLTACSVPPAQYSKTRPTSIQTTPHRRGQHDPAIRSATPAKAPNID